MQPKKETNKSSRDLVGSLPSMWLWGWPEVGEVTSVSFKMPLSNMLHVIGEGFRSYGSNSHCPNP
jgi:hypothetical protein